MSKMNKMNEKWLKWFIGFSDAEGNFQVYPKKRVLKSGQISKYNVGYGYHLSLHKRDIVVLKMIKQKLNNIGTIYEYEIKPDARLAVNDVPSLLYLMETVFQEFPFITKNQYIRYLIFKHGLSNNIKEFKTLEQYNLHMAEILSSISIDSVLKDRVEKLFENNDLDN